MLDLGVLQIVVHGSIVVGPVADILLEQLAENILEFLLSRYIEGCGGTTQLHQQLDILDGMRWHWFQWLLTRPKLHRLELVLFQVRQV
jgi:hypothetical protein